jgi:hypothetical protein
MTDEGEGRHRILRTARGLVIPNTLLGLVMLSILLLILTIFVFGDRGKYPSPDLAEILRTVSIGGMAAAVTALIDRSLALRDLDERLRNSIREATGISRSLTDIGIRSAYQRFDFSTIFHEARRGDTVSWLDTYCPRQNEFVDELSNALKRGVNVRMLIIDPACDNARFRDAELEGTIDTGGGWTGGLQVFIAKMNAIARRRQGNFEIRSYSDLPCVPMYLIGKPPAARKGYFSIFLTRATAHCAHVELRKGEWLDDMAAYFEKKWDRQGAATSSTATY